MPPWLPLPILVEVARHQNLVVVQGSLGEDRQASLEGHLGIQGARSEVLQGLVVQGELQVGDPSCRGARHQGAGGQTRDEDRPLEAFQEGQVLLVGLEDAGAVVRGDFHKNRFPVEEVEGGEEMMETVREKGVAGGSRHIRLVLLVVEAMEMVEDVASLNPPSCVVLVATKEEDRVEVSVPSYKTDCFLERGLVVLLRTMQGPQCEHWQVEVDLLFSHQYHLHCPLLMAHLLLLIGPLLYVCPGLYSPQQCSAYLGSIPQFFSSSSPQPSPRRWQACRRSWGFPTPSPKTRQCLRLCPPCQGWRRLPTELPPRRATFSHTAPSHHQTKIQPNKLMLLLIYLCVRYYSHVALREIVGFHKFA